MGEGVCSVILHLNLSPFGACISNLDVPKCFHSGIVCFFPCPPVLESVIPDYFIFLSVRWDWRELVGEIDFSRSGFDKRLSSVKQAFAMERGLVLFCTCCSFVSPARILEGLPRKQHKNLGGFWKKIPSKVWLSLWLFVLYLGIISLQQFNKIRHKHSYHYCSMYADFGWSLFFEELVDPDFGVMVCLQCHFSDGFKIIVDFFLLEKARQIRLGWSDDF